MRLYEQIFVFFNLFYGLVYILVYLNVYEDKRQYLEEISFYYKMFVSFVLIYYFNPITGKNFKINFVHRRMITSVAFVIISTEGFSFIYKKINNDLRSLIKSIV